MDTTNEVVLIWVLPVLTVLLVIIISTVFFRNHPPSTKDSTSNVQLTDPDSSPSSSSQPGSWDVFLSFYGKDTRRNFISHLYNALDQAGIQTFRDDPALRKGEEISSGLYNAIKNSKKFVIVISENYARSSWCLDELVEILGCRRTENQVVPVFYYVNPSDLRYQKGSFEEAFKRHKERYSVDMIDKWKSALTQIAELSGYHLRIDANENESDTIQNIVENVLPQASTNVEYLEEYLFGIDSAVEEIYQKLSMNSNDVRVIGICGVGGIGKTTTAKAFYNKYSNIFDISCFIENVRQLSTGASSLLPLVSQLLIKFLRKKDYKVPDVESGIRQLKQVLYFKKALIILDDLDQSSHSELLARLLKFFSPGSRIVITGRDANLVNQFKEDVSEVDYYMVKNLGQLESIKLFTYHAFRKSVPTEAFIELSKSFAIYAGGHPLVLKVLGSSLRGRTQVSFWKDKLEKVRKIPDNEILKILQLSYEELSDETEKAIFLDIVFFFVGKDKDDAGHIFKSCDFFPDVGIQILVDRCLLTIGEDNKFQMHNLIQELGKVVSRQEIRHGRCRRLYLHGTNVCNELKNLKETEKIEVLIIDLTMSTQRQMTACMFERLPNLRLLEIIHARDIKGSFENSFHELRCIRWSHCPWTHLPSSFLPGKLVSLQMRFNEFRTLWKDSMPPVSLKTIDVSYSKNLRNTNCFRDLKLVERLILRGCKNLIEVHPSIGRLTNLGYLDMSGCHRLESLPESTGQLTNLGHFDLHNCHSLQRLPEPVKQLTNLGSLDMHGCSNLKQLPDQLGDMLGLKRLDVSYTAIVQLPDSLGQLINLVALGLGDCRNLTCLPESICKLRFLRKLVLTGSGKLERLPEQIGKMESLEVFYASHTAIKELPESIGLLSRLQYLTAEECDRLKCLPSSFGNLTSLTNFIISSYSLINVPVSVQNLKKLKHLEMVFDMNFMLPMILKFSFLQSLRLRHTGQTFSSPKLFSLYELSNLTSLHLIDFTNLGSFLPELPLNLKLLEVINHTTLEQLPDLSRLKQMKEFSISSCISLQSIASLPPHLKIFIASECTSLQELPDLSRFEQINELRISNCISLQSIASLPPHLEFFKASTCTSLQELPDLSMLKKLKRLTLNECSNLKSIASLPPHLGIFEASKWTSLQELPDLSMLKELKRLTLNECSNLKSIASLPPHLKTFSAYKCTSLQELPDLSMLKKLRWLTLNECSNLKSISLEQSSLQVGGQYECFNAHLQNIEIPEWFNYRSCGGTITLTIPPDLGDNFLGVAVWVVYHHFEEIAYFSFIKVVFCNKTEGITEYVYMSTFTKTKDGVQSRLKCISGDDISGKSGDIVEVSFQRLLHLPDEDLDFFETAVEVEIVGCGVHVLQRTII